jgi:hypothetical protein
MQPLAVCRGGETDENPSQTWTTRAYRFGQLIDEPADNKFRDAKFMIVTRSSFFTSSIPIASTTFCEAESVYRDIIWVVNLKRSNISKTCFSVIAPGKSCNETIVVYKSHSVDLNFRATQST